MTEDVSFVICRDKVKNSDFLIEKDFKNFISTEIMFPGRYVGYTNIFEFYVKKQQINS